MYALFAQQLQNQQAIFSASVLVPLLYGVCESNEAEFRALDKAIQLSTAFRTLAQSHVIIETDSKNVFAWAARESEVPWKLTQIRNAIERVKVVRRDVPQQYQVVPPVAVAPVIEMAGRAIISLPRVRYLSDMRYDTCIICLNDFIEGEELVALQCDHVFHYRCMDEWLTWGTGCPICRASTT
ncbi:RING-H2 finger protein ATL73-like [Tripterygium wilfordii]|uniref:RING-H2 finger protein ATL73-like n=1 Tax=Tripterygium wilfordii TaxID=458696 RepID=UPI0018F841C1|nr:RING-H2 finger protein ATL73-like [Tripterygium wilfordii]